MFTTLFSRCTALAVLLVSLIAPLQAAEPAATEAAQAQVASDLVSTLENDTERQALIEKLKALSEVQ